MSSAALDRLLAILLVPLDVGIRRVALSRADMRRSRDWLAGRLGLRRTDPEAVPGLAELRAARERTARRTTRMAPPRSGASSEPPTAAEPTRRADGSPRAEPPVPGSPADAGTLAERLARRRRGE